MAHGPQFFRGVAAVPQRRESALGDTADIPRVGPHPPALWDARSASERADGERPDGARRAAGRTGDARTADLRPSGGRRADPRLGGAAKRPVAPGRGMIVRRRWRQLRSGAGWTWTGVSFVLVCWGIWVVSVRGTELAGPVIGLVLVLATGVLLFVLARLLGRAILEQALGRKRPSAWPSHLTVCGFLTATGITFLQQTQWIRDTWQWFGDTGQLLSDAWSWLVGL